MKQAEYSLLMSALSNRERLDILLERDPTELFTEPDSLTVFYTLRDMLNNDIDPDLATLAVRLEDTQVDKAAAIISEMSKAPVTVNFTGLMSEITRHNSRRRIQDFAHDLYDSIKNGNTLDAAVDMLTTFQDKLTGPAPDVFASMKDLAALPLDDVFQQHPAIKTGIDSIDGYIPGFFPGQLIITAARPGMGKTSLALQIAANLPGKVLFFSLEMSRQELYSRRLSMMSSVEAWKIETSKINEFETQHILKAQDAIRSADNDLITIDRQSDINSILNTARRFIRHGNVSAIFVDYLQLITGGRGETQNYRIADITRRFKQVAIEYGVPVMLMSQLNRAIEYHDREPILSDLRDSGAIEQDADIVIFIHDKGNGETNLIFAKNRKGRTGKAPIQFEKRYTRFVA